MRVCSLPLYFAGHFAAEDHGDFVGLADGSIHIQQPLSKII
jgi:hypothetical protein